MYKIRITKSLMAALLFAGTAALFCGTVCAGAQADGREARKEAGELVAAIGEEPETGFDPSTGSHGSITRLFFSTPCHGV